MSLIDPISYSPIKTDQGTRDEALDFYSNPKNQKAHATLYRPAEWLVVSLRVCFNVFHMRVVRICRYYLFIQADFKPLPTYANIFQDTPKPVS